MKRYSFRNIQNCEMCEQETNNHKILGQRLNQSQGLRPRKKKGISVSVQKCSNCGLIYSNPQPIPHNLQDHYGTPPEKYWTENYFELDPNYFSEQIKVAKKLLNHTNEIRALDIGAGIGKAMTAMNNAGFDSYGIEPSEPFYKRAISRMGIDSQKIHLNSIEDFSCEKEQFDFITFGAVFEHLYEPSKALEKALKWLKKDGVIHIEVPSSKWVLPKFINFYYKFIFTNYVTNLSPMHPPYHLHEFSKKSFEKVSEKLKFKIEKCKYDVCSIYFFPKIFHPFLKQYMKVTNTGMQLTIFLRKI